MNNCAYIFLDESGNLDFGKSGTRYFVLTCIAVRRPFTSFDALDDYKHTVLEKGGNIEYFHCYNDTRRTRSDVFNIIASNPDEMRVDSLVVDKATISEDMQGELRFYPTMLGRLLSRVIPDQLALSGVEQVIIITDTIPVNRRRQLVERAIRTNLSATLPEGSSYRIFHHQSRSHYGLQVVDYCCWAVYRKWEMGDSAWFDRIKPRIWRAQGDSV